MAKCVTGTFLHTKVLVDIVALSSLLIVLTTLLIKKSNSHVPHNNILVNDRPHTVFARVICAPAYFAHLHILRTLIFKA
jgi:hypothetical protein